MKEPGKERGENLCVALFDVDGTLIRGSSSFVGTRFLFKRGMVGINHMMLGLWYAMLHGLGLTSYERMYEIGIRVFVGMRVDELLKISRLCFEKHVLPRFFTGALETVQDQRERGREIVLVSAGPRYLIQVIGEWIRADAVITAGPLVEEDRVTDVLDGPVCSGKGKVQRVREYLWKRGMVLGDCVCYADSINDLPLLELAGQAITVNPDPRLKRVARLRGWKILRFRKTTNGGEVYQGN